MAKATAAASNVRLVMGGLVVLGACLLLGVLGGLAYGLWANRTAPPEPAVEYILDASPRMAEADTTGESSRLVVARAVLAEIVRPADGRVTAGLRVFGTGAVPSACQDTALLVPLAPASQGRIAGELTAVQAGQAADAALAEAMLAAIRDLSAVGGPHTLVVVTGGQDSCSAEAGQLVAQEAERAGIALETFIIGYQLTADEAAAIRSLASAVPGATLLETHDRAGLEAVLKAIQARVDAPETTPLGSIVGTAQALPPTPTPGLDLTLDEAAGLVEDGVIEPGLLDHEVLVFPWPEPLDPDDLLLPFAAPELGEPPEPMPVPAPSWFFWVDDFPGGKFAHPGRFVLVDIDTGALTVQEALWWPVLNGESLWVDPADYWNPANWSFSRFDGVPLNLGTGGGAPLARANVRPPLAPARQGTGQGVALVVNGWQAGEAGAAALAADTAGARAAFAQSGLAVTYLGPANDPARDGDYSPEAFNNWTRERAGSLVAGDTLVVYLTGHGDGTAVAGLSPAALLAALRPFEAGVHLIVILDSSYSGAFIPALSTTADRLISATDGGTPALFDVDPPSDPNGASDQGSEFTSGFVEDWLALLNDAAALAAAHERAANENRPVWDVLAELSFHSAVAKDAGAASGLTVPQMVPATQPTPTPTVTPSPTPTGTPVPPTTTPTLTPRPPTATPTLTPVPQPFVNFTADAAALAVGQCTTLRWDSGNIQALFLNQQGVVGTGQQEVCPSFTTIYTLRAEHAAGQITREVTVTVTAGAPPGPPAFGTMTASTGLFWTLPDCGPTEVTLGIIVTGAPQSASLFYRVVPPAGSPSAWQSLPAALAGGSTWSRLLTADNMPAQTGQVEFYFTATNAVGTSHSNTFSSLKYEFCVF